MSLGALRRQCRRFVARRASEALISPIIVCATIFRVLPFDIRCLLFRVVVFTASVFSTVDAKKFLRFS